MKQTRNLTVQKRAKSHSARETRKHFLIIGVALMLTAGIYGPLIAGNFNVSESTLLDPQISPHQSPLGANAGDPVDNLIALYSFEEILDIDNDGVSDDFAGYPDHYAAGASAVTHESVGGIRGNYVSFEIEGDDDYIEVPGPHNLHIESQFSWGCWLRPDRYTNLDNDDAGTVMWLYDEFGIRIEQEGTERISAFVYDGSWKSVTGDNNPAGQWHHVFVSLDGNTMKLYVNGNEIASRSDIGSLTQTTNFIRFGSQGSVLEFPGDLDDVRIYNVALTETQIKGIMAQEVYFANVADDPEFEGTGWSAEKLEGGGDDYFQITSGQAQMRGDYTGFWSSEEVRGKFSQTLPGGYYFASPTDLNYSIVLKTADDRKDDLSYFRTPLDHENDEIRFFCDVMEEGAHSFDIVTDYEGMGTSNTHNYISYGTSFSSNAASSSNNYEITDALELQIEAQLEDTGSTGTWIEIDIEYIYVFALYTTTQDPFLNTPADQAVEYTDSAGINVLTWVASDTNRETSPAMQLSWTGPETGSTTDSLNTESKGITKDLAGMSSGTYTFTFESTSSDGNGGSFITTTSIEILDRPFYYVSMIGSDGYEVERTSTFTAYFVVEDSSHVSTNGVEITFSITGRSSITTSSSSIGDLDGIASVSFDTSFYSPGDVMQISIPSTGTYSSETVDLVPDGTGDYSWDIIARKGTNKAGIDGGFGGSVGTVGADIKFGEELEIVSDGTDVLEMKDIYKAKIGIGQDLTLAKLDLGPVGDAGVSAQYRIGVQGRSVSKLENPNLSSMLMQKIVARNLLIGLKGVTSGLVIVDPLIINGIKELGDDIAALTTFDSLEAGLYAEGSADVGGTIGYSSEKDGYKVSSDADFSLLKVGVSGELGANALIKYKSNGHLVQSLSIGFDLSAGLDVGFLGGSVSGGLEFQIELEYESLGDYLNPDILPADARLSVTIKNPTAAINTETLVEGKLNFLSVLNGINIDAYDEVTLEFEIHPKAFTSEIENYAAELFASLTTGTMDCDWIDALSGCYDVFEHFPIEYKVEGTMKNSVNLGIGFTVAGTGVSADISLHESFGHVLSKGYIALTQGAAIPAALVNEQFSGAPGEMSVKSFIADNFDYNQLIMDVLEAIEPDFLNWFADCPVYVTVTDDEGRITGWNGTTWVAEIPDSSITTAKNGEAKIVSVPKGGDYTMNITGYEDGSYNLTVTQFNENALHQIDLLNISTRVNESDLINSDPVNGTLNYTTNGDSKRLTVSIGKRNDTRTDRCDLYNLNCNGNDRLDLEVQNWESLNSTEESSVTLYYDRGNDGTVDDTQDLAHGDEYTDPPDGDGASKGYSIWWLIGGIGGGAALSSIVTVIILKRKK